MKRILLITALLCLPLQFACTREQEPRPTTTPAPREKPQLSDSDLKNQILARFQSDPQLRNAGLSVSADASENTVTLSGTVESEALRTKAVQLAKSAHPGVTVIDKIDVKPASTR
jgi:osmotically-inducible protein OsmY